MGVSVALVERIKSLIETGLPISSAGKRGVGLTFQEQQNAEGWLTSASHVVQLVVSDYLNPYRQRLQHVFIASQNAIGRQTGVRSEHIDVGIGVLKHLLLDIDAGLVATLVDRVRAEVFDDFLDHAEEYYKHGRKEAGVIAGVVFEDALRRIAEKNGVPDSKVDTIITSLAKKQVFTDVKAKRARAAADVRTKATHAKWSEFDLSDVHNCIVFTRELISSHLQ